MSQYLLGIDAGTTSFKAAVFTMAGELISVKSKSYALQTPAPAWVELPAETYFETLQALLGELFSAAGVSGSDVRSLAISSQGETLICLDGQGRPTRNAIVWLDNRAEEEAALLRDRFGLQTVYETTGQAEVAATWTACKILWIRRHEPDVFQKTEKFLLLEDYLLYRLTGVFACEPNLLCSSLLYDIRKKAWWGAMLAEIGIDERRLPAVYPCGAPVAQVSAEAAAALGLSEKTLACTGALDQTCGIIGAGNVLPGAVTETTGSCLAVSANLHEFIPYRPDCPITCQNHAVDGRYIVLLSSQTAGMVLKWFTNAFYKAEKSSVPNLFRFVDEEAAAAKPGCDGLLMLPHLTGAGGPEFDSNARGVFFGVTLGHGRGHFARAILEAVAFMLKRNLDQLEALGLSFDSFSSMGGGAMSPLWSQIKADVTSKTVEIIQNNETACLGAAVLAGVGCGAFPSVDEAVGSFGAIGRRYLPDPANRQVYDQGYARYIALYEALKPLF